MMKTTIHVVQAVDAVKLQVSYESLKFFAKAHRDVRHVTKEVPTKEPTE